MHPRGRGDGTRPRAAASALRTGRRGGGRCLRPGHRLGLARGDRKPFVDLHGHARRRLGHSPAGARCGGAAAADDRRRADRAGSRLPDGRLPQPGGARRARSGRRHGPRQRLGAHRRERPRRGPAGGRDPGFRGSGRLAPAQRERGRHPARRPRCRPGSGDRRDRDAGLLPGLHPGPARDRRGCGLGVHRDADRLQMDLPHARTVFRLRGGPGLPGEPRNRPRQGRPVGRGRLPGDGAGAEGGRPQRRRPAPRT